ncbi:hypothetical protein BYT27DRAFT_7188692 [Phlegmacium glaucopus]|nr:hypothetical protein BYT27DRAFT_7188692 [Phlegmacium glaucopus]
MSEFDSLSDSDWLDISSGRDSDDNDSLCSQDSDHEINSMPLSRRSSISNGSSMNGEVEAWEGFVSDSGDEVAVDTHAEALIGMYHAPLPSTQGAEPIALGFIPDINDHSAAAPEVDEEDRRVRDALDQSFVSTLSASRTSTTGGHFSSTHTSIHDLRLSFPDPLTSSHDELNRSYEAVSPTETTTSASTDNDDTHELTTASVISSSLPEDPGITITTPEVQYREGQHHLIESEEKSELEIVLYGASPQIKWQFIQDLVQKAAANSGRVLTNALQSGDESVHVQTIRLLKDSEAFQAPFFNVVTVHDRTGDKLPPKFETDTLNGDSNHLSLAVVYLPTPKLPILPWHTSFFPVLVSSSIDLDSTVALQAAEDDWDLLCVPANKTLNVGGTTPVFDSNKLLHLTSEQAYGVLQDIGREAKKPALKPITEQVKSMNAVTLFALMSIIMGFAFNTTFRPSTPAPTPTINTPSSSNSHLWGMFAPLPNRSMVSPSANTAPLKDMALSVFNPGTTALSVTSTTSMALSIASSSNSVAEVTNISPSTSSGHSKCIYCKSTPRTSTDMIVRSESATALSEVHMKPSVFPASRTDGSSSGSNTILFGDRTAGYSVSGSSSSGDPKVTISNPKVVGALSEQIQNLNEEMIYRNERAKNRARELKKRGEELLWDTQERLVKRTERAKRRARELGKVLESEAWATYQKVQGEMGTRLSGGVGVWGNEDGDRTKGQEGKQKKSKKDKENAKACRKEWRRLPRNTRGSRAEHCQL